MIIIYWADEKLVKRKDIRGNEVIICGAISDQKASWIAYELNRADEVNTHPIAYSDPELLDAIDNLLSVHGDIVSQNIANAEEEK
ncbi:MAG TPA: hypothetical protein ENI27_07585 [bacterium]|nr:hypothetical protein [bacterium]